MTFEEYLIKKRINKAAFEAEDTARYSAWESMFGQMHQNSFYMAVKMIINDVRLKYHLKEEDVPKTAPAIVSPKPVIRRAPVASAMPAPKTDETASVTSDTAENEPASKPATFKPRPIVKRPASLQKPPVEGGTAQENQQADKTNVASGSEKETENPAFKPRPVIKRPVISKPSQEVEKLEEDKTAPATALTDSAGNTDKPARPRPVIKRPAALQRPAEEDTSFQQPASTEPLETGQPSGQELEAAKPARPRPVIKRPVIPAKPVAEQKLEQFTQEVKPASGEPAIAPKTPRPRPVIKKPVPATPAPASFYQEENKAEKQDAPPIEESTAKPPRPRPIIKRPPPKTDETGDAAGT